MVKKSSKQKSLKRVGGSSNSTRKSSTSASRRRTARVEETPTIHIESFTKNIVSKLREYIKNKRVGSKSSEEEVTFTYNGIRYKVNFDVSFMRTWSDGYVYQTFVITEMVKDGDTKVRYPEYNEVHDVIKPWIQTEYDSRDLHAM